MAGGRFALGVTIADGWRGAAPRERFTFVWHNGVALCAPGELTERPNVTVLKTVESSRAPWVQIPHSPPDTPAVPRTVGVFCLGWAVPGVAHGNTR